MGSTANFMSSFFGNPDQAWEMGQRLGLVFNDMRNGYAKGEAMRAAQAEAERLNSRPVEVNGPDQWTVEGQTFTNGADAAAYAKDVGLGLRGMQKAPSKRTVRQDEAGTKVNAEALYLNRYLPEKISQLRANGWDGQATQLEGYINSEKGKKYATNYARLLQAHAAGNFDAAAKHLEALQELSDESSKVAKVRPLDGGGYAITLIDPGSGQKNEVQVSEDRITGDMGMFAYMDPVQMVRRMDEAREKKAAAMAALAKQRNDLQRMVYERGLDFNNDVRKMKLLHSLKLDEIVTQDQLNATKPGEIGRKVRDLRESFPEMSDEQILQFVKGGDNGGYGKATNPETVAARLHMQFLADPTQLKEFGMKSYAELSPAEQKAVIAKNLSIPREAAGKIPPSGQSGTTQHGTKPVPLPMW